MSKDKSKNIEHWQQLYIQAKESGNKLLMSKYEAIIKKLGGKVPKI